MPSAYSYEQTTKILAEHRAGRTPRCPLCGGSVHVKDASSLGRVVLDFSCLKCGATDDSDRAPDT